MTFDDILEQVITLLKRQGRVSYRALKMRFEEINDEYLDVLKEEILFAYPVVDEDGRGLVWTSETGSPESDAQREVDEETKFYTVLRTAMTLLRQERRVTYRELKHIFGLDDALLSELREELLLKRLAVDEEGKVLVWMGEMSPVTAPVVDVSRSPTTEEATVIPSPAVSASPFVSETPTPSNGPTAPPEAISIDVPQDDFTIPSQPTLTAPEAERRQLTVMFCDLADSTKLSQELDPEDLREVIRAYQQTSAKVIRHFDGYIAQHLGDGLLIYFGWPRAHEDDAQRALHSGLGIVEAITTKLNPRLEQDKGVQLTVRLGVHTGPVVVGEMGGSGRQENLATGETVNIAARLEGLAAPNTVVISSVTERLVRGAFTMEYLGPHELKGVAESMQVFRVLSPAEGYRDEDESLPDGGVFLVGRVEEVGLLLRRWEQSKEGLGQVVLISGEAGIGKSSLTATIRTHIAQEGSIRITFRCSPYHTNSALYPVITHLEQMLGFDRGDTPGTKLDKLEQTLGSTSLPLDEAVPLMAMLLSVPLEDRYPAPTSSPQQQRQQTLDTLVAWLMEEAERQPVLAVWEDMHWGDPSTLEILGLVLEQTPTVPMLHLLTFRHEFTPPWSSRSHMTPITLNRLERPQVEALITHMTGDKALPTEVVEHIVSKTDGVPLYVEELTKMLLTSDLLKEETDQYVLTGPLNTVAIPDTLQDSLMARLDQMNTAKELAQIGAVLGREFAYEMLEAISSQDEETLQNGLAQLVEAELLYQRGRPPRATYIFKHALIQDVAYTSLLRSQRQRYHRRIAHVLEDRFSETAETQPELLAHHLTEGGLNEQAIGYWHNAGQRAVERSANMEAIEHYKKALEVLRTLPDTPERTEQEIGLLIALGQPLNITKGYGSSDVEHVYAQAYALCQRVEDSPHLFSTLLELGRNSIFHAEYQRVRELGEQLLALAESLQEPERFLEAHFTLGTALLWMGELETSLVHIRKSHSLYESQKSHALMLVSGHDHEVGCLTYEARALWFLGYPDQGLACPYEALSRSRALSHPFSQARALTFVAHLHHYRREAQQTQKCTEELLAISREHGYVHWVSYGVILGGWALAMQGQVDNGIAQIQEGMADQEQMGHRHARIWWLLMLAEAYCADSHVADGLQVLTEAFTLIEQTGQRVLEAETYRLQGELLLQQSSDNQTESETCFHQAITIARRQQAKSLELRAATSLAKLWQSQAKRKEAYDLLEPVYSWFTEGHDTADLIDARSLLENLALTAKR